MSNVNGNDARCKNLSTLPIVGCASAIAFVVLLLLDNTNLGWVYTGVTMFGSIYFAMRGESTTSWGNYIISTFIGITYFVFILNTSQIVLVAFFCAMNWHAVFRLRREKKNDKAPRVERYRLLFIVVALSILGTTLTMIIDITYAGWVYTILTIFGSVYITTTGETMTAWCIYVTSAAVGAVYFAGLGNASQFSLSLFFGVMNSIAAARLHFKPSTKQQPNPVDHLDVVDKDFANFEYTRKDLEHPFIRDVYTGKEWKEKEERIKKEPLP